jgi:hypothetical protein
VPSTSSTRYIIRVSINYINKLDFFIAYTIACTRTIAVETICNRFAATSLVLYNPKQVLSKLNITNTCL